MKPRLIVAMGATAAFALTGRSGPLSELRGEVLPFGPGCDLLVTVHPAYLLRISDRRRAAEETERFRADLRLARQHLASDAPVPRDAEPVR